MATKKKNDRCPLQDECEKVCTYTYHERDCNYYQGNARPGVEIEDQAAIIARELDEKLMEEEGDAGEMIFIPITRLSQHPDNPRKDLGDLTELADSIKENGILQNLTVVKRLGEITGTFCGSYTVVIGHRRLAAAKLAGLKEVPCIVVDMTLQDQVRTMLMENIQRADLTVYEQAQGFQLMLNLGDSVEDIARKSGFSQTTVRRRVKLLSLDQEKFKASVDRGATLQDYMELDKIEDPDLKNEVLEAIGTNNFRQKLQLAVDKEKDMKYIAEVVAVLETFAERDDSISYGTHQYVRNYSTWNKKDGVQKPEDAGTVHYYFRVSKTQVDLYKDRAEETAEDAAEKERKERAEAELKRREAELLDARERAYGLRLAFVREYSAAKKHLSEITRAAGYLIMQASEEGCEMDYGTLSELLDIDYDAENEEFPTEEYESCFAERPEYTLLASIFAGSDSESNGYSWRHWDSEKRAYVVTHEDNGYLDYIYKFLESLGYEMSDEEKLLQNGAHELFAEVEK